MSISNETRILTERAIVRALIENLARAGFVPVCAWNGDEYAPWGKQRRELPECFEPRPLTVEEALAEVFSVDDSTLHFAPAGDTAAWGNLGVFLVGGNGNDIISDYHCGNASFAKAVDEICLNVEDLLRVDISLAAFVPCEVRGPKGEQCSRPQGHAYEPDPRTYGDRTTLCGEVHTSKDHDRW
jgi:hypothetical protein